MRALGDLLCDRTCAPWHFAGGCAVVLAAVTLSFAEGEGNPSQSSGAQAFRVCSDPNNLPFSNQDEAGFENKLADLIAADLGQKVSYTWWAQRRGFVRNTLRAEDCDVVIGVPKRYDLVETTQPYYRSTYVFVSRADRHLDVGSIHDPRLRNLKIGVQLVGEDGFNTPPAHAIALQGMTENVTGYSIYGDYRAANPPARIVTAVENGDVDIAAVWGPLAGYFAKQSPVPLALTPIEQSADFVPLVFQFDIAMGVRKGDHPRREQLDQAIARNQPRIRQLLETYGVPLVEKGQSDSAGAAK